MSTPTCPQEMKDLWAVAQQLLMRYAQVKEHPHCPIYREQLDRHMTRLRAACTRAEPHMERQDDDDGVHP